MGYAIKCSECGEVIESMHRHDYVTCKCGKTFVDGGTAYLRCGGEFEKDDDGCPVEQKIIRAHEDRGDSE